MKICITSQDDNLNASVDPRFGRAQYLIFVDIEKMEFETVKNLNVNTAGGAGTRTAQMVVDKGVETVITGNVGPNARRILDSANVKIIENVSGVVREVIEKFKKGELN